MTCIDWLIVLVPTAIIGWISIISLRYVKGVAGFMAGHRIAGRYVIANAAGEMGVHVVSVAAMFEVFYKAGFTMNFWQSMTIPVTMFIALLGWVIYRYRETRAMTMAQFFEIRYSKRFRIFTGMLAFVAGVLNYGIAPAVASRFFVYFCGLPQDLHMGALVIPTFVVLMLVYLPVSLLMTLTGGQLTIMVTDCIEGLVSLFFYFFISIVLIMMFSWSQMHDVLTAAPPGLSPVNPFDTSQVRDFNIWYVLIGLLGYIYGARAWQGGHAFNSSAASPHEAKMAGIIAIWRDFSRLLFTSLLAICAYTFLKHPDFSAGAQEVNRIMAGITDSRIADQMRMPIALGLLLPMGLKGIVCAMFFLAMIAGDGSALHSWGSIFVQDIVVPIRKTPLSPKHHMLLLRLAVTGVAVFGFTFSILYRQTDYILMFLAITGAVYIGGAGSVIIGGLYWKKGTTAAAWCAMLIGSGTALLGIILQQPSVWESLRSFLNWSGNNLSLLNGVADLPQWAANMPPKFPVNGRWMALISMLSSLGSYVLVSLLTCRQNFNLERMLHRGKYAIEPKSGAAAAAAKPQSIWTKLIGIDSNFTLGDRVISISLFSWKMFWVLLILGIAVWNLFSRWPTEWWTTFWRFQAIYIPLVLGAITVVWILWGGIRDLGRLFVSMKAVRLNEKDDGVVVNHHNLDEDNAARNNRILQKEVKMNSDRKSEMVALLLSAGIGLAFTAGAAEPAASEPLKIQVVAQIGQEPPAMATLAGPRKTLFALPEAGRSLNVIGRLGASNAVWKLRLLAGSKELAALMLDSPIRPDKYDMPKLVKHKGARGQKMDDDTGLNLMRSPETGMNMKLQVSGTNEYWMPYFVRPNLNFYVGENVRGIHYFKFADPEAFTERDQMAKRYPEFPSALARPFTLRLERAADGLELWLDGRFLAALDLPDGKVNMELTLSKGNELVNAYAAPGLRAGNYLPLDIGQYSHHGKYEFASGISGLTAPGINLVEGVPVLCVDVKNDIDVGLSRWLLGSIQTRDFYDADGGRHAFDGCPESIILQTPKEQYTAAHVLCAVEPGEGKIPALTLRVSRFSDRGRGDAYADTTVYLPKNEKDPLPENVKKAGTIKSKAGKELPAYLVKVPLKQGEIPDLLDKEALSMPRRGDRYLDIELTKEVRVIVQFFNTLWRYRKPDGLPSAVHVFAMTLERNPADIEITSREPGNIFYAAENPAFEARITNRQAKDADYAIGWDLTDFYGKKTSGSKQVTVKGKATVKTEIPLSSPVLGYYSSAITVKDKEGREIWRQPMTYVLLPPDTRQAGEESPFGLGWIFMRAPKDKSGPAVFGPAMKKLGMRHMVCSAPAGEESIVSEAELAPYKVSYSMLPDLSRLQNLKDIQDLWKDGGKKLAEIPLMGTEKIEEWLARNPHIRQAAIFHEYSVPGTERFLPELEGKPKPPLPEAGKEKFQGLWKMAEKVGEYYRTKHPDIKLVFGNSPWLTEVQFMRHGFPKKYMDYLGIEQVVGGFVPHENPDGIVRDMYNIKQIQKLYGYDDVPLTCGIENFCMPSFPDSNALTELEHADWYVRYALLSFAYGFKGLVMAGLSDAADGYYNSPWGSGGFCRRAPLLYPKPTAAAMATLTLALDKAQYQRYLDTGSHSLYALEFLRDKERVYPLWTLRGKREMTLTLEGAKQAAITDCMGNTQKVEIKDGKAALTATTSPMYLITDGKAADVSAGKAIHAEQLPKDPVVLDDFSDPSKWRVDTEPHEYLNITQDYAMPNVMGKFKVEPVNDEEKGKVTELTLEEQPGIPSYAHQYASLCLKEPVTIANAAGKIGLWVKGNSCWGRVYWEFTDANGEIWFSESDETSGWYLSDWKCYTRINFDGWRYIWLHLPKRNPGGTRGPHDRDWGYRAGDKDGVVQFPIKVTRVVVAMRDRQIYVTDMLPAQSRSIRLGPLAAGD